LPPSLPGIQNAQSDFSGRHKQINLCFEGSVQCTCILPISDVVMENFSINIERAMDTRPREPTKATKADLIFRTAHPASKDFRLPDLGEYLTILGILFLGSFATLEYWRVGQYCRMDCWWVHEYAPLSCGTNRLSAPTQPTNLGDTEYRKAKKRNTPGIKVEPL
jgi:hypothetical protein